MTNLFDMADIELAARYAPTLLVDEAEPYEPVAMGYSLFRSAGGSPSSKFPIEPVGALTIEYAIYYDWDIGHLYDLEHVWVHVGDNGEIRRVEASSHGGRKLMDAGAGLPQCNGHQPIVYVEAGKHAHWAAPTLMTASDRTRLAGLCGALAGHEGVHMGNLFAERGDYEPTALDHRLARLKMQGDAFQPSHRYRGVSRAPLLQPWQELERSIPGRVASVLSALRETQRHLAAIFLDCGDTLIDERTEIKSPGSEVVTAAELIPGAREMVEALRRQGHRLVLVADGPRQTFVNMLTHHGLWDHFDAHVISEDVGALKPDARMFDTALTAIGLTRADTWRTVMVGNNLSRDIKGANDLGITSVFMAWSSLRSHEPVSPDEVPDYKIVSPDELPALLDQVENLLRFRVPAPFLSVGRTLSDQ